MSAGPRFRIWPPVALGAPWLAGVLVSVWAGDPVSLDSGWARGAGWLLIAAFAVWNGWALLLMGRHGTALLPGGETTVILDRGPFAISRNPLYIGLTALTVGLSLLVPSFWALVSVPIGFALVWWGAVRPEERYLTETFGAAYTDYRARVRRWF